jgi:hypothetical protein
MWPLAVGMFEKQSHMKDNLKETIRYTVSAIYRQHTSSSTFTKCPANLAAKWGNFPPTLICVYNIQSVNVYSMTLMYLHGTTYTTKMSLRYFLGQWPLAVSKLLFSFEVRISCTTILFPCQHKKVQYFVLPLMSHYEYGPHYPNSNVTSSTCMSLQLHIITDISFFVTRHIYKCYYRIRP